MPAPDDLFHRPAVYSVPRRYGLGTMLFVTAVFAVFFGVLTAFHVPAAAIAAVTGFRVLVALGQMFLFRGRRPREASMIVGVVVLSALQLVAIVVTQQLNPFACFCFPLSGAILGYFAGTIDAGVFLLLDGIENTLRALRAEPTADQPEPDPFRDRGQVAPREAKPGEGG